MEEYDKLELTVKLTALLLLISMLVGSSVILKKVVSMDQRLKLLNEEMLNNKKNISNVEDVEIIKMVPEGYILEGSSGIKTTIENGKVVTDIVPADLYRVEKYIFDDGIKQTETKILRKIKLDLL